MELSTHVLVTLMSIRWSEISFKPLGIAAGAAPEWHILQLLCTASRISEVRI